MNCPHEGTREKRHGETLVPKLSEKNSKTGKQTRRLDARDVNGYIRRDHSKLNFLSGNGELADKD